MTHRWAFDLSMEAVRLLRRDPETWVEVVSEKIEGADIVERLDAMVMRLPEGVRADILLPRDQILYTDVPVSGPEDAEAEIAAALDGRTPYRLDELEIDWQLDGAGLARVAVIARDTLDEAAAFAEVRGIPVGRYSSLAGPEEFPRPPDFGGGPEDWAANDAAPATLVLVGKADETPPERARAATGDADGANGSGDGTAQAFRSRRVSRDAAATAGCDVRADNPAPADAPSDRDVAEETADAAAGDGAAASDGDTGAALAADSPSAGAMPEATFDAPSALDDMAGDSADTRAGQEPGAAVAGSAADAGIDASGGAVSDEDSRAHAVDASDDGDVIHAAHERQPEDAAGAAVPSTADAGDGNAAAIEAADAAPDADADDGPTEREPGETATMAPVVSDGPRPFEESESRGDAEGPEDPDETAAEDDGFGVAPSDAQGSPGGARAAPAGDVTHEDDAGSAGLAGDPARPTAQEKDADTGAIAVDPAASVAHVEGAEVASDDDAPAPDHAQKDEAAAAVPADDPAASTAGGVDARAEADDDDPLEDAAGDDEAETERTGPGASGGEFGKIGNDGGNDGEADDGRDAVAEGNAQAGAAASRRDGAEASDRAGNADAAPEAPGPALGAAAGPSDDPNARAAGPARGAGAPRDAAAELYRGDAAARRRRRPRRGAGGTPGTALDRWPGGAEGPSAATRALRAGIAAAASVAIAWTVWTILPEAPGPVVTTDAAVPADAEVSPDSRSAEAAPAPDAPAPVGPGIDTAARAAASDMAALRAPVADGPPDIARGWASPIRGPMRSLEDASVFAGALPGMPAAILPIAALSEFALPRLPQVDGLPVVAEGSAVASAGLLAALEPGARDTLFAGPDATDRAQRAAARSEGVALAALDLAVPEAALDTTPAVPGLDPVAEPEPVADAPAAGDEADATGAADDAATDTPEADDAAGTPSPAETRALPAPTALARALTDRAPRARPGGFGEAVERQRLNGWTRDELATRRPSVRPPSAQAAARELRAPEAEDLALADSAGPRLRPEDFDETVKRSLAAAAASEPAPDTSAAVRAALAQPREDAVASAYATPRRVIPSGGSVAQRATIQNAIDLSRINLVGVYGLPSDRRALIRLPSGRYVKVKVGDRVEGGVVAAIGDDRLTYRKGGRTISLALPAG